MKNLLTILIFAFLSLTAGAETFNSYETVQSTKENGKWSDWVITLPADGSHMAIHVHKRSVVFDNYDQDVYTLERNPKRNFAEFRGERAAVFCYQAVNQKGEKYVITICRTDRIYAIQVEKDSIMVVYQ
jgi:hypothetical protein